jgi:hypothetical protein
MTDEKRRSSKENKLWLEWQIFFYALLRPVAIVSLALTLITLTFANRKDINQDISFLLQTIAALLAGVWGGFIWDTIKDSLQNSLLFKKGLSAVRSLSLSRGKIRNLIGRSQEEATKDELINLLSLLEKDIANATQEWHDIVPGIKEIEEIYSVLTEREAAVANLRKQIEQLNEQLTNSQALNATEKLELEKKLKEKESHVLKLSLQINELRSQKDLISLATTTGTTGGQVLGSSKTDLAAYFTKSPSTIRKVCKKCGRELLGMEHLLYNDHCLTCTPIKSLTDLIK